MLGAMMAYSDEYLMDAIKRMDLRGPVSIKTICKMSGVPYSTAKKSLQRLEDNGLISRERRGKRWGSIIEVVKNAKPN